MAAKSLHFFAFEKLKLTVSVAQTLILGLVDEDRAAMLLIPHLKVVH